MIPLLGPGSMLCRIKKFVMHFQVKSLSGKSFTWSESMGPANLYSGLQKLPQSLWKPFLWLQKGLDHLEPLHTSHFENLYKKGRFFNYRRKPITKTQSVFSFFKDHCPLMNPHLSLQKHVVSIQPGVNGINSFQIPFGVSVGWKFELKPLLNELYWAFGLYSVMKNLPNNFNLCKLLY